MATHCVGVVQSQPARFVYISRPDMYCLYAICLWTFCILIIPFLCLFSIPKLMTRNLIEYSFTPSRKFPDFISIVIYSKLLSTWAEYMRPCEDIFEAWLCICGTSDHVKIKYPSEVEHRIRQLSSYVFIFLETDNNLRDKLILTWMIERKF